MYLYDDGGNLGLFVADQGDVGIGTDTPDSVLHVDVGAQDKNIKFSADATFSTGLDLFSGTQYSQLMQETTGELSLKNRNQDENIQFLVNDGGVLTTAMTVEGSSSEVGIGTSLPEERLTVSDNIQLGITDSTRYIYFDNGTANNGGFRYNATSDVMEYSDDGTTWTAFSALTSGLVTSVSNSDGTLTISPTTGDVVASLNLSNANTWLALQTFNQLAGDC
ncbi:MAG: hypothetical protein UX28_C0003G0173 [Candidatus Pacebacteria bacterium GW2011_GWA1_46_10]|nr:MAG: hypothetical protein UX28_C0003G0173 [Candidatus Pacebacteria bacterium GW2011_GWA1_46_10]